MITEEVSTVSSKVLGQAQNADLSITQLIIDASPLVQGVMLFLLLLSIVSWTLIIQRGRYLSSCKRKALRFEDEFWGNIDLNQLYQNCKSKKDLSGMEKIFTQGFTEFARLHKQGVKNKDTLLDGTYRAMKVTCAREIEELENHLPTLATIGSISPYIGLFGTVWGIMSAFIALSAVKNATLAMVAPPIAEALIATAMGLFAAIPAVMFYNRYATKVEKLENQYLNFIDEFSTILNRNTAANNQNN
ncbi:MAG: protein TolQ [Succinivibrionaceae bacterium]